MTLVEHRIEEFKQRLARTVRQHTCDMQTREWMDDFCRANKDKPEELAQMVAVLHIQMTQLIDAVLEQK